MKQIALFFKNIFGVILFFVIIFSLSQLLDYLSPKLITLGWISYIVVGIFQSIIVMLLQLSLLSILFPLFYLISSKIAKLVCAIIGVTGFIYSVITPWQYANAYGYSLIVVIWCITLTIFIFGLFYSFVTVLFSKP